MKCVVTVIICRDWRGLAHLIGLKAEKIPVIACDSDPSARVISIWQKQENSLGTIKQLQDFLGELDRFDIVDDIADMIGIIFKSISFLSH